MAVHDHNMNGGLGLLKNRLFVNYGSLIATNEKCKVYFCFRENESSFLHLYIFLNIDFHFRQIMNGIHNGSIQRIPEGRCNIIALPYPI